MFKLNPAPTFVAQVPLSVPGQAEPVPLSITFKHKTRPAFAEWHARAHQMPDAAPVGAAIADIARSVTQHDVSVLKDVIEDWSGLVGADGAPVPYTVANLGDLLDNYPASAREIYAAYKAELTEAKRKNS